MPAIKVTKSTLINAPVDTVYAAVRDFKQWPTWSPWLIMERDCSLSYADDGKSYSWEGRVVGAGKMSMVGEDASRSIDCDLAFIKPWKSQADVQFTFVEKDGGTELTWFMDSKLPIFMFMMTKMMTAFIGMDYERGLSMLKDLLESGRVPSNLEFPGRERFDGFEYIGIETSCSLDEVGPAMEKDMTRLGAWREENGVEPSGPSFSIYKKWDMVNRTTNYIIGFPVATPAANLPSDLTTGTLAAGDVYKIRHTGAYRHLGNAWSAGYAYSRAKVFAEKKKAPHFEVYENDAAETAESDLVTVVHFPVKA